MSSPKVTDRGTATEPPTRREPPIGDPFSGTPPRDTERRHHTHSRDADPRHRADQRTITELTGYLTTAAHANQQLRQLLRRHRWTSCTAFIGVQTKAVYTLATTPVDDPQWTLTLIQTGGLFTAAVVLLWPYATRLIHLLDPAGDPVQY